MQKIILLAGGHIKNTEESKIFDRYLKRIHWPISIYEAKDVKALKELFQKNSPSFWIALDESGDSLTSENFSMLISKTMENHQRIGFIIGVDSGIPEDIKKQCSQKISFSKMTWPHLLARVLFIEQLYRAQQIINLHPYHRS